ncbi:MAG: hemerythrin family protein [Calditrichaeota bacterium]|nr:hemerythrin family protein [Calditrichota bacterium]
MDKISWKDEYSVGIKEIDAQHKKLINIMNRLIEMRNARVDSELISETLTEMTEYASKHFETEEKYMVEYDYPDYDAHKKVHKEFKKKTAFFCVDTMSHKETIPIEILTFLKDWWINHILKSDMKYKEFFREKGVV